MPRKSFKNNLNQGVNKFFSANDSQEIPTITTTTAVPTIMTARATHDVQAATATHDVQRTKRLNIRIEPLLKEYIAETAWRMRMSEADFIRTLVIAHRNTAQAPPKEGDLV